MASTLLRKAMTAYEEQVVVHASQIGYRYIPQPSTLAFCFRQWPDPWCRDGVPYLWRHCARVADTWKTPYEACCSSVQVGSVNQSSALSWVPACAPILFNESVVSGWMMV